LTFWTGSGGVAVPPAVDTPIAREVVTMTPPMLILYLFLLLTQIEIMS
jgi:hypothetical protein